MVGLIIATHGELGKAFKESIALLTGECKNVVTLALEKNDNSEEFREKMEEGIKQVDQGDGVILFTDVLGGTPSNMATLLARKNQLYCMTGVNLPMIIEFVMSVSDQLTLQELVDKCYEAAIIGVKITNKL